MNTTNLKYGVIGGLAGGVIFGAALGWVYARLSLTGRETREDANLLAVRGEA